MVRIDGTRNVDHCRGEASAIPSVMLNLHPPTEECGQEEERGKITMALNMTRPEIGAPTISPILAMRNGAGRNASHIPTARPLTFSGWAYTQASNCGTRKIAVSVKSTMKTRSQAGRDHCNGDQIMVPKEVTKSSRMWLRMPT